MLLDLYKTTIFIIYFLAQRQGFFKSVLKIPQQVKYGNQVGDDNLGIMN